MKVWRIRIGENYTSFNVVARNMQEAITKALKHEKIPREYRWVSHAELIAVTDIN